MNYDLYFKVFDFDEAVDECFKHAQLKIKRKMDKVMISDLIRLDRKECLRKIYNSAAKEQGHPLERDINFVQRNLIGDYLEKCEAGEFQKVADRIYTGKSFDFEYQGYRISGTSPRNFEVIPREVMFDPSYYQTV